jgi:hypothetical protein
MPYLGRLGMWIADRGVLAWRVGTSQAGGDYLSGSKSLKAQPPLGRGSMQLSLVSCLVQIEDSYIFFCL